MRLAPVHVFEGWLRFVTWHYAHLPLIYLAVMSICLWHDKTNRST